MTALYEMTGDMLELQNLMDAIEQTEDGGGDESTMLAIRDTLEGMALQFNDKAVAIVKFAQALDGDTSAIDAEIKRLQERKRIINNRRDNLREYLRYNMEASGITKIDCPLFSITLAKGVDRVQIDDEAALPDEYVRVKTDIAPDKTAIAKALKNGQAVPGAQLVKGPLSLRVK
ncbi:siphovirus Gp157 family protein [Thiomicrorhabdus cannonii]|uniref:siphovirus Gp157 family protein n=1 Tax=Thiomicrorhabdus cannonii TaxID=2748011 RepID=UPI0015C0E7FC|nr:siphovirus Gp157 family protein [Thiomicrorhabdus cannonii]